MDSSTDWLVDVVDIPGPSRSHQLADADGDPIAASGNSGRAGRGYAGLRHGTGADVGGVRRLAGYRLPVNDGRGGGTGYFQVDAQSEQQRVRESSSGSQYSWRRGSLKASRFLRTQSPQRRKCTVQSHPVHQLLGGLHRKENRYLDRSLRIVHEPMVVINPLI